MKYTVEDEVHDAEFEEVPFEQGMTLLPGQSTRVTIPVTILDEDVVDSDEEKLVLHGHDITHEVYDRYAECTLDKASGLWYSDVDTTWSGIRPGALPCPRQDTPELTKIALDKWCRSDEIAPGGYKQIVAEARRNYVPPPPKSVWGKLSSAIFGKE